MPRRVEDADRQRLYEVNEAAAQFYTGRLDGSRAAAEYLLSHGISHAAAPSSPWRLGYAPARWTTLADHLRSVGFSDEDITDAGLGFRHRTTNHLLDRFRDRLMFPITDEHNRVIAFTGRDLSGRASSKWINSPETAIYHKSEVLYGLGQQLAHRPSGTGEPVIFIGEGAADVLALHDIGQVGSSPAYAVAPCGTNLTRQQLDLLERALAGAHLILAFDGDDAGNRAVGRAYPIAVRWPGRVSVARLPPGRDPASILGEADPSQAAVEVFRLVEPLGQVQMTNVISDLIVNGRITDPARYPGDRRLIYQAIAELFVDSPYAHREMAEAAAARIRVPAAEVIQGVVEAWAVRSPPEVADIGRSTDHEPEPDPSPSREPPSPDPLTPPAADRAVNRSPASATARSVGRGVDTTAIQTDHHPLTAVKVWVLADGIGDRAESATAAAIAADVATAVALRSTPAAGLHAARAAINAYYSGVHAGQTGDASIIVVAAHPDRSARFRLRYELAWAGDCRAYTLRGGNLVQVTADHTVGRARRAHDAGVPHGSVTDLLLTSSVRSGDISICPLDDGPLLVCNNAIHRTVSDADLAYELAGMTDAQMTADRVAEVAGHHSGARGTAAVVLIHALGRPPSRVTGVSVSTSGPVVVSGLASVVARASFAGDGDPANTRLSALSAAHGNQKAASKRSSK